MTVGNDCWIELSGVSGMPLPSRMPRVTQGTGTVPDDTAAVPPIESDVHVQVTGAGKTAGAWVYDQDGAAGMKWLPVVSGSSSSGGSYAADITLAANTAFSVAHNLKTEDVTVAIYTATTPKKQVDAVVEIVDADNIHVTSSVGGDFRIVVKG